MTSVALAGKPLLPHLEIYQMNAASLYILLLTTLCSSVAAFAFTFFETNMERGLIFPVAGIFRLIKSATRNVVYQRSERDSAHLLKLVPEYFKRKPRLFTGSIHR